MGIIGVEAVVMGWLAVRFAVGLRGCCSGSEGVGSMDERACLHQRMAILNSSTCRQASQNHSYNQMHIAVKSLPSKIDTVHVPFLSSHHAYPSLIATTNTAPTPPIPIHESFQKTRRTQDRALAPPSRPTRAPSQHHARPTQLHVCKTNQRNPTAQTRPDVIPSSEPHIPIYPNLSQCNVRTYPVQSVQHTCQGHSCTVMCVNGADGLSQPKHVPFGLDPMLRTYLGVLLPNTTSHYANKQPPHLTSPHPSLQGPLPARRGIVWAHLSFRDTGCAACRCGNGRNTSRNAGVWENVFCVWAGRAWSL